MFSTYTLSKIMYILEHNAIIVDFDRKKINRHKIQLCEFIRPRRTCGRLDIALGTFLT